MGNYLGRGEAHFAVFFLYLHLYLYLQDGEEEIFEIRVRWCTLFLYLYLYLGRRQAENGIRKRDGVYTIACACICFCIQSNGKWRMGYPTLVRYVPHFVFIG